MNKANKVVTLKVATTADGRDAPGESRSYPSEAHLRNYDWVEGNRLHVIESSGGKLGYLYLPDTADAGYNAFNRDFFAQLDKQGLIVDARFNQGGVAADYIIDILRRVPPQQAQLRDGEDIRLPTGIVLVQKSC